MKAWELQRYMGDFEAYNVSRNLSPRSIDRYRYHLGRFFRHWEENESVDAELTARAIRRFIAHKVEHGNAPNTIRVYVTALRAIFSFLVADGIIAADQNPMMLVKNPRSSATEIRPLSMEEARAFLDSFDKSKFKGQRNYAMCALILDTGLRVGEITRVKVDDVDFEDDSIAVNGKGRKRRRVFFGRTMRAILKDYLSERSGNVGNECPTLFPPGSPSHRDTLHTRYFSAIVRKHLDNIGVPRCHSSAHRLRHSFAVNFIRNGGNAFALQRLLGHSKLEMTQRYVLLAQGDLREIHHKASPMDNL